jgi:hypothetical protein
VILYQKERVLNYVEIKEKTLTIAEKLMIKKFLFGDPIIIVKSGGIKADTSASAIENAINWAKVHAEEIIREDIGMVVFNEKGVKNSLSHKFGQRKLDAIQAIPCAIKQGKIARISNDLDGKPVKNIFIVAPIQIDAARSFLFVRLVKNIGDDNRLHVHEVFDLDDTKNTAIPFQTPGTDQTASPQRGIAIYLNILQDIIFVNTESERNTSTTSV